MYWKVQPQVFHQFKWFISKARNRLFSKHRACIPNPVYGFSENLQSSKKLQQKQKYVLLSYITTPFTLKKEELTRFPFSNFGIARSIVQVLNELGYIVDIVEWRDTRLSPQRDYDLFIGHAGYNFKSISERLPKSTIRVYFFPSCRLSFLNEQESVRLADLKKRRGIQLSPVRSLPLTDEPVYTDSDAVICFGNDFVASTFDGTSSVFALNNAAYPDSKKSILDKNFVEARRNFLFFAGIGNVHKGLDLLLEAFDGIDADLWIATKIERDFALVYKRELNDLPNIHLAGWINPGTEKFYNLIQRCAYIVMPSCCEGSPGSIIECMHQRLIPVLSRESGISTADFGITLESCDINEIRRVVKDLAAKPANWCRQISQKTIETASREFSVEAFLQNFRTAITEVTKTKK